jgi:outer membrane protein insertion porin family
MIFMVWTVEGFYPGSDLAAQNNKDLSKQEISKIDVHISGIQKDSARWESMARDLVPVHVGDRYDPDTILKTITILVESTLFKDIQASDPIWGDQGVELMFRLSPVGRIKDIIVTHAFPIFRKEVVNVMTIYNGDAFSQQKLDKQAPRIIALFKKQGYLDPKVTVSGQKDETDDHFVVHVDVEKGDFLPIKKVVIQGNNRISSARLKLRIKTWKASVLFGSAGRFIQKDLDEDVKNLITFYRKKGYADVEVTGEAIKDEDAKTIDGKFHIKEGSLYKIALKGNNQFWDYTLKKEMTLAKDGNENNFALKKSVRNMKKKYAAKGYPGTKIQTKIKETKQGEKPVQDVTLQIEEGYHYIVSKIEVKGNTVIDEKTIKKQMLTRIPGIFSKGSYVPKTLAEDIGTIRALYLKEGYTQTQVQKKIKIKDGGSGKEEKTKSVEIELMIDEGIRTQMGTVRFNGLKVLTFDDAIGLISLRPGQVYREYMIKNDESVLRKTISERGYPNITVKATPDFNPDRSLANLVFEVDEGPFVRVGQIVYTGNFRTKETILNNEMTLSPQGPLSLTKLLESRRNMMNMTALDSAKFRALGLKEKTGEVDLVVEVEEKKPYFFEIGGGYDTERHFYANTTVGDHNFLGRNLDVQANLEVSQIGYQSNISLTEPRLFASRLASGTRVFAEQNEAFNKDFGTRSYGAAQDFYKNFFLDKLTANLGFVYEFREQYLTEERPLTPEEEVLYDPRTIFVTSPAVIYRTTDSYVSPRKGTFTAFYVDISKGLDNNLDDFVKYRVDTRYYYTPFEPVTFAVRGWYGFIEPYGGNKTIPEDQLFFLGGASTVRGFDENLLRFNKYGNAVGGREVILGTLEARYDLGLNVELTPFYDIGSVREADGRGGSDDFRASVGIGLRYMTPVGPIGLLYGWKLDPKPNESSGKLNFSMGYAF